MKPMSKPKKQIKRKAWTITPIFDGKNSRNVKGWKVVPMEIKILK